VEREAAHSLHFKFPPELLQNQTRQACFDLADVIEAEKSKSSSGEFFRSQRVTGK
jgi:hypothetical protein